MTSFQAFLKGACNGRSNRELSMVQPETNLLVDDMPVCNVVMIVLLEVIV